MNILAWASLSSNQVALIICVFRVIRVICGPPPV